MKFKNPKIETLYEYFSKITIEAYKDPYLISNAILSKQKTKENILESYLENKIPIKTSLLFVFKKLLIYFFKNIVLLILTIISSIFHRFSGQSWNARSNVEYIFLDTFFSVPNILKTNKFEDHYFPGLSEYLIKIKKNYVIIPKILGSKNPFVLFRIFKILNNQKIPAITHYQALCFFDYLKALKFIIFYPFFIFRTIQNLGTNPEDKLTRSALFENLDCSVLDNYLRFLFAQRLTFLVSGPIKCISWFENVSGDKNFFLGLRSKSKNIKIIGAQLFLRDHTIMNLVPDENEIPFKVVPDKILVNGPGYLFNSELITISIGPSLRYRHLFNSHKLRSKPEYFLIIMPYWDHIVYHIFEVLKGVDWPLPLKIKFHPDTDSDKFKLDFPGMFSVTNQSIPSLLNKTFITIGCSPALIEAASLGIPVIQIQYLDNFNHDYMPEIGKGILWDIANDAKDINNLINMFQLTLNNNPYLFKDEGRKIKSFCFSEPNERLINTAFDLS